MSTTGIDDPKQITTTFEAINKRISIQLNSKLYLTMKCHCLFTSLNYCFFFYFQFRVQFSCIDVAQREKTS